MKIKPPGTPFNGGAQGVPEQGRAAPRGAGFQKAGAPANAPNLDKLALDQTALAGVAAKHAKADLKDPAAVDSMVREVLTEMFRTDLAPMAKLSQTDQARLVDFMANDPICRKQVENLLERTLR